MGDVINMCIYSGGEIKVTPYRHYEGGRLLRLPSVDVKTLTYAELCRIINAETPKPISKVHYRVPEMNMDYGLRFVYSDAQIKELVQCAMSKKCFIYVYVEHDDYDDTIGDKNGQSGDNNEQSSDEDYYGQSDEESDEGSDEDDTASLDHLSEDKEEVAEVRLSKQKQREAREAEKEKGKENNVQNDGQVEQTVNGNLNAGETSNARKVLVMPVEEVDDLLDDIRNYNGEVSDGTESEYADSSDYDTPVFDSDDDEVDKNVYYPVFDHSTEWNKMQPIKGMRFASCEQLKHCLTCYAANNGYHLKWLKTENKRLVVCCRDGCSFRLHASMMQKERSFQIKSVTETHTCVKSFNKLKIVGATWIAKMTASVRRKSKAPRETNVKRKAYKGGSKKKIPKGVGNFVDMDTGNSYICGMRGARLVSDANRDKVPSSSPTSPKQLAPGKLYWCGKMCTLPKRKLVTFDEETEVSLTAPLASPQDGQV